MTPPWLAVLLAWAAPPLIGAAIGYLTNDIAIRMLFRPLRAVRVLGLRLPFTPGIIPKERGNLAVNIGRMVSRELITEEALRRQVHEPRTLAALGESVAAFTEGLLARPVGSLAAGAEAALPLPLEAILAEILGRAAGSRSFIALVHGLSGRAAGALAGMRVADAAERLGLQRFLAERLLPALGDRDAPAGGSGAGAALARFVAEHAADLLSDETIAAGVGMVEPLLPAAVERLVAWVGSPETRAAIGREARTVIASAVEGLNLVQRLIVGAAQFEQRLDERMPEIVGEIVGSLERLVRSPANQTRLLEAAASAARTWRDDLRRDPSRAAALEDTVRRLAAGLSEPDRSRRIAADIVAGLARGDATLGGLASRTLGLQTDEAAEAAASWVLTWISREGTADRLSREISAITRRFIEEHAEVPLGRLLGVDGQRKARLDSALTGRLVALIDARLPEIRRGIDVEDLVVRKIDALDVRDVERLLMQVLAKHLQWINVFGAILGALIGFVQVLLGLFTR
jgi:uncharacterized membrane-anchored protein YjiN (DUF445 family)